MSRKKEFQELNSKIPLLTNKELIDEYEKITKKQSKILKEGTLNKYLHLYRFNLRNNIIERMRNN